MCAAASVGLAATRTAVFEFELEQGSVVPGARQDHEAEQARLRMIGQRLRDHLARTGHFEIVDIAPVAERAEGSNLQACGNCADQFARDLGAELTVTGYVYKVSELVLSMSVIIHESATSAPLTSATVDFRGNTDEAWRRGIDYLYRNILAARLEKLTK